MYSITITTGTNVGDNLISESARQIIKKVKGNVEFLEFPIEKELSNDLSSINKSSGLIIPHFAIRDPGMYPETYRLVNDLTKITVPIIPMGAGWKGFPGDYESLRTLKYSTKTKKFLQYIGKQVDVVLCRDYFTCEILKNHGVLNTIMGGDCAWYDLGMMGKEMRRPVKVEQLVFTTPHASWYHLQATKVIDMLNDLFPNATKYCSMHSGMNLEDAEIANYAQKHGFEVKDVSNDVEKIKFYKECDLHVGYRVHAHIYFLRNRIPSVLLHEDGRGVGFSYTFGIGGFNAFLQPKSFLKKGLHYATHRGRARYMIADPLVHEKIRLFIKEELQSHFLRYIGLPKILDETYETKMKPWLESLP